MNKKTPIKIIFVNQPNADRLYKAWAEIEATRERKGKQNEVPESR